MLRAAGLPLIAPATIPVTLAAVPQSTGAPTQPAKAKVATPQVSAPPIPAPVAPAAPVSASAPGVTSPRPIYRVEPSYTDGARTSKLQGSVLLGIIINDQGRPEEIKVIRSLDPGLDEQAVQAVQQWQFTPGMKDGAPVSVTAVIEVNFRLL